MVDTQCLAGRVGCLRLQRATKVLWLVLLSIGTTYWWSYCVRKSELSALPTATWSPQTLTDSHRFSSVLHNSSLQSTRPSSIIPLPSATTTSMPTEFPPVASRSNSPLQLLHKECVANECESNRTNNTDRSKQDAPNSSLAATGAEDEATLSSSLTSSVNNLVLLNVLARAAHSATSMRQRAISVSWSASPLQRLYSPVTTNMVYVSPTNTGKSRPHSTESTAQLPTTSVQFNQLSRLVTSETLNTTILANIDTTIDTTEVTTISHREQQQSVDSSNEMPTNVVSLKQTTISTDSDGSVSSSSPSLLDAFHPVITAEERFWLNRLLNEFADRLLKWNITGWFLHGGTLLGCYRFDDFIPWDDDVDVSVADEDRAELVRALTDPTEDGNYTGHWDFEELNYKFYTTNYAVWTDPFPWPWPSIDIFFHRINGSVLSDVSPHWQDVRFDVDQIHPLGNCSIAGRFYPAPANIPSVLRSNFGDLSVCKTHFYNHKTGTSKTSYELPCSNLTHIYQFKNLS